MGEGPAGIAPRALCSMVCVDVSYSERLCAKTWKAIADLVAILTHIIGIQQPLLPSSVVVYAN